MALKFGDTKGKAIKSAVDAYVYVIMVKDLKGHDIMYRGIVSIVK